jgi:hypothetical protein
MKKNIKDFTEVEREYCEHCDEKGNVEIYFDNDRKRYIILHEKCRQALEHPITREMLFNTVLWKTQFIFKDLYESADEDFKERIHYMSVEELQQFVNTHLAQWSKALEDGIMFDWSSVANTSARETFPDEHIECAYCDGTGSVPDETNTVKCEECNGSGRWLK